MSKPSITVALHAGHNRIELKSNPADAKVMPGHLLVHAEPRADINEDPYVLIQLEGTGDMPSPAGHGWPIMVEVWEGKPRVIIWGDINKEDPTHVIDLSGALESRRDEEKV